MTSPTIDIRWDGTSAIPFIEQLGGRLEIESGAPGTTVRARLPLMEQSA